MATVQEVQEIYKDLLGREAAQGGLDYWTQGNQGSLEDIRANIAAGGEAKEYASRKTAVEQIYDDFGLTKDEAGVEHWIDSGDDFQKIQDDIGTHFQAGGSRHDEAKTKLQDIYDDHYGKKQDGTSNQVVDSAGLDYWLGEGGLTEDASGHGGMGSWDTVKENIKLHDNTYASLDKDDDGVNDPIDGDPNGDGIIDDDEVTGIKDDTLDDIDSILDDIEDDDDVIIDNVFDELNNITGGVDLVADDGTNLAAGTLDQVNNDAVNALDMTLDGATTSIKSLDTTKVLDDIQNVGGDLTQLQGDYSTLGTSTGNTGADNITAIENAIAAGGYDKQVSDLDSTFSSTINNLTNKLFELTGDITDTKLDVTNLSGDFQSRLDTLKADLTDKTSSQFNTLKSDYDSAVNKISSLETSLNNASTSTAEKFANQKELFDAKLAANMATQQNNFTNLTTDVNSKLTDFSQDQKAKFENVYKTREQAIGDLQTNWGKRLQEQESGLQQRIQMTSENLNERLTNISKNMNYRMLGDSAAGIKMRRSKAFTSGRTAKGTGQMNRAMRIQTLNL